MSEFCQFPNSFISSGRNKMIRVKNITLNTAVLHFNYRGTVICF